LVTIKLRDSLSQCGTGIWFWRRKIKAIQVGLDKISEKGMLLKRFGEKGAKIGIWTLVRDTREEVLGLALEID
jgi:hypothetical protein